MSLRQRLSTPEGKRQYVRTLFATIAERYDLITVLLSYGRDRAWKRRLVAMSHADRSTRALDLATGTGDLAYLLRRRGARVVGLDITAAMIALARRKESIEPPHFLVGDMMSLPFVDSTFDLVTTGYGLRNVSHLATVLEEIARVLRPGGRLLSLDFNRPTNPLVRGVYFGYLTLVGSALGWILHRDANTYRYIAASLRTYPDAKTLSALMKGHGFRDVRTHRVLGGLLTIHRAEK